MFGKTKTDSGTAKSIGDGASGASADDGESSRGGGASGDGFLLDRNKPSVISEGFSLEGNITAHGTLHVEGFIKGTVRTDIVNIGPSGSLEGEIACKTLHVKGSFGGTAVCEELVIAKKARVSGQVTYRTLAVQRGAIIEGELLREA